MLKFLVDESSGRKLNKALKERNYDTLYCGELFAGYPDEAILRKAQEEQRILITNDKDFGEIIFRQKGLSTGLIFLRLKIDNPDNRIKVVLGIIKEIGIKLKKIFVIASENKIRIRKI